MEQLLALSRGPTRYVTSFSGYIVNGFRFHIQDREINLKTQNSGVVVLGNIGDGDEDIDYYGVVTDMIELQYLGRNRVVLFRCKWWDVFDKVRGIKEDEYGFISINCNKQLKTNEPFILASQARQAFYVTDNVNRGWKLACKSQPRNFCESLDQENDEEGDPYQHGELFKPTYFASSSTTASAEVCTRRVGIDPIFVH